MAYHYMHAPGPTAALQRQYRSEVDVALQQYPGCIQRLLDLAQGEVEQYAGGSSPRVCVLKCLHAPLVLALAMFVEKLAGMLM